MKKTIVMLGVMTMCIASCEKVSIGDITTEEEWNTDITVTFKDGEEKVIDTRTLENIPFKANRVTHVHGRFFQPSFLPTFTIDMEWEREKNSTGITHIPRHRHTATSLCSHH